MLSDAAYRYLTRIYEICGADRAITPKSLGAEMQVKRSTAYEFIKKLENAGYLEKRGHEYYLTNSGINVAKDILRRHRVIETLLYRNGVDINSACALATKIQRDVDSAAVERIYENLGSPKCCPHGKPIPR
ncbi:MAG: metal-dependent transcriptional regulator [Euryarchaeota archaeon]|nr:metal-dependent transcriptional regulator [Euryarchaeota archaeon]